MKHESMPTQRHKEKRVEERASTQEREREREKGGEREREKEREREREREIEREREKGKECQHAGEREHFGSSIYMFSLPLGRPYANWASQECFVLPEVLTLILGPSFDLPFFYFRGLFPSLSFSHCHFGLLFPILTT